MFCFARATLNWPHLLQSTFSATWWFEYWFPAVIMHWLQSFEMYSIARFPISFISLLLFMLILSCFVLLVLFLIDLIYATINIFCCLVISSLHTRLDSIWSKIFLYTSIVLVISWSPRSYSVCKYSAVFVLFLIDLCDVIINVSCCLLLCQD